MPILPCTKCGTMLDEPAYYRLTTAQVPNRHSVMNNVLWLCQACYATTPPDEQAVWLARRAPPADGKSKSALRSLLDSWMGRSQKK